MDRTFYGLYTHDTIKIIDIFLFSLSFYFIIYNGPIKISREEKINPVLFTNRCYYVLWIKLWSTFYESNKNILNDIKNIHPNFIILLINFKFILCNSIIIIFRLTNLP